MHVPPRLTLLALLLFSATRLPAQDSADTTAADTPPAGSTVITSDEMRMDQDTHTAVFTGNVIVVGTNFNMKCQEMTVVFVDGKVDNILSKGDVVIVQPDRVSHSGQAQYFHDDDKFVLTDQPTILDNKNTISAPKIIIYRTKKSLLTEGRTRTVLPPGGGPSSSSTPTPDPTVK